MRKYCAKLSTALLTTMAVIILSACATTENEAGNVYQMAFDADKAYGNSQWHIAEPLYLKLTKLVPDDPRAFFRLGNVYLKQGKLEQSVAAYNSAIFRSPEKAKYYNNLAVARILQAQQALNSAISKAKTTDVFISDTGKMLDLLENITKKDTNKKAGSGRS